MGTVVRSEISKKNKYWIEKHRYYELKHFCLQYPIWKKAYFALDGLSRNSSSLIKIQDTNEINNPTERCAESKIFYSRLTEIIERAAIDTDKLLSTYILKAVTEGLTYDYLKSRLEIPCCRDTYYELYRKFFWILNHARN